MSVYPTGLTSYFSPEDIPNDTGRVLILDGPIVVKSFAFTQQTNFAGGGLGNYTAKLFDGIDGEEIFRIYTASPVSTSSYGGLLPRLSFNLPMNGIRVRNSLMLEFTTFGNYSPAVSRMSVLYQR